MPAILTKRREHGVPCPSLLRCIGRAAAILGCVSLLVSIFESVQPVATAAEPPQQAAGELRTASLPKTEPVPAAVTDTAAVPLAESTQAFQSLLTKLVLEQIPHDYEDNKNWGQKGKQVSGLYAKLDGLKLDTHREFREVNHGTWTSYRVELVEPDKNFQLRLENLRSAADGRVAFDLIAQTPLHCTGRMSQWQKGVQLISLDADARADVRLTIRGSLRAKLDLSKFPPDVAIDPHVDDARLEMNDFQVHRISKLGGTLSESLGKGIRHTVEAKLADQQGKVVSKLNAQIDKHRDRLRFSPADLARSPFAAWSKFVGTLGSEAKTPSEK